jgi:Raf kinase inhibitor-like YbhB/YbcL family protein
VDVRKLLLVAVLVLALGMTVGCSSDESDSSGEEDAGGAAEGSGAALDDATTPEEFTVVSTAFVDDGQIPVVHANTGVDGGENVAVPLSWKGAPAETVSFALIMVDRHPSANEWVHWMVTGIPPTTTSLDRGASGSMPAGAIELLSTNGQAGYQGPQPPAGSGDHEYETLVFALDVETIDVAEDATYTEFLDAIEPHHLAETAVSGYFGR